MKKLIILFGFLALISCNEEKKTSLKLPIVLKEEKVWISKNQKFLDKFKTIDIDTLKVFSGEEVFDSNFEFFGKKIERSDSKIFPSDFNIFEDNKVETYAIYKFEIDKNNLGLIARTPSEYWPTSLKLFVYDKNKDKITNYTEIGESWGDAGDRLIKKSWFFKNKNDISCFLWVYYAHDNSVDEDLENPSFIENHYFLLNFKNGEIDTISKNNKQLEKQFSNIIKKNKI